MTSSARPPAESGPDAHAPGRLTAVTGLVSVIGTVVLALTGHPEAAAVAGIAGSAVAGGIHVTVNVHRRPPGQE